MPATAGYSANYGRPADLLFAWIPFAIHTEALKLHETVRAVAGALTPNGMAFIVGPSSLQSTLQDQQLRILQAEPVESLPTFRMHRTILPKARIQPQLTVITVTK